MTDIWHIHIRTYGKSWCGERHEFVSGDEKWVKGFVSWRYGQDCSHVTVAKITPTPITKEMMKRVINDPDKREKEDSTE